MLSQAEVQLNKKAGNGIGSKAIPSRISFDDRKLKRIVFDQESKIVLVVLLFAQLLFPNGVYLFACLLTAYLLFYFIQQPLKSGVFMLIAFNHILQIIASVWQAIYVGKGINVRSPYMSDAVIASCIGLLFLFLPILFFQHKIPFLSYNNLKREARKLSTGNTFNLYLASFFMASFLGSILFVYAGLAQVVVSLIKIKWFFFLLFGYQAILKNEKRNLFYLFIGIEFISGFFSFFSSFKTVIYALVILLLGLWQIINIKKVIYGSIIGSCMVLFALVWTSIKTQYRSFINEGSREQVVSVSREEAINKIYDLSSNIDEESLNSSTYQLLDRLQYTYHFAKTIGRVPSVIPFQNGKNWMDNIEFVTTPRMLNPDKPSLDATEKTKKYTGLAYSGRRSGASFSLGYFAECYIDFGLWGMMFPLLLIGLLYGLTYYWLMRNASRNYIFNFSLVGAFFMEFYAFESDGTLLIGRFLATFVTFFLLIKLVFPSVINYITEPKYKTPG